MVTKVHVEIKEFTYVHDGGGRLLLPGALTLDLGLDGLSDGQLARALADLRQISTAEALCYLKEKNHVLRY